MTARDLRRDWWTWSSLSLRERVQSLLNPDAEVKDIFALTPGPSPEGRGVSKGR
jgi:hypothetical protein